MRYGVLADIHGNLPALTAAVRAIEREGVDGWLVAGDLVGYGPHPNECIRLVARLDATTVAGNHDLIALGRLSDERCIELARASLRWTRRALSDESASFLAALPVNATAGAGVVVAHGSLDDPQRYITETADARAQLTELASRPDAGILVLGHTHRPLAVGALTVHRPDGRVLLAPDEPVVLNPGAVGQSREMRARARAMVLDTDRSEATFLRLPYDVEACRRALVESGLSPRGCHLRPSPMRVAGRRARSVARRALARTGARDR